MLQLQIMIKKIKAIIFDWGRTLFDSETKKEFEDSEAVLSFCAKKGLSLAVASLVSEHALVDLDGRKKQIESSPLRKYFSFTSVTDGNKDDILDEIVSKLGFERKEIMIVDDRVIRGIKYGNLREHPTVWLKKGKFANELPNNETGTPSFIISHLSELVEILKN